MDLGIQGKKALITAAGRGIGAAVARVLAYEGVQLMINARTASDLNSVLASIPDDHHAFACDLSTDNGPAILLEKMETLEFKPDIVVHNLGGNLAVTDPLCDLSAWRRVQRINLEVPIELNRALIPHMKKQQWGRICHTSSIAALENQGPPSYCAAKAALTAYTRSLGRYVSKDNVIINNVLPGPILTEDGYWDEAMKNRPDHVESYLKRVAIGRFGSPEEVSHLVAFMCSEHTSFCVGSSFVVDGGQGRSFQTV